MEINFFFSHVKVVRFLIHEKHQQILDEGLMLKRDV